MRFREIAPPSVAQKVQPTLIGAPHKGSIDRVGPAEQGRGRDGLEAAAIDTGEGRHIPVGDPEHAVAVSAYTSDVGIRETLACLPSPPFAGGLGAEECRTREAQRCFAPYT